MVIIVLNEVAGLSFEIAGQIVILQQGPVLQSLMPSFDLALGLGMIGRPSRRDTSCSISSIPDNTFIISDPNQLFLILAQPPQPMGKIP